MVSYFFNETFSTFPGTSLCLLWIILRPCRRRFSLELLSSREVAPVDSVLCGLFLRKKRNETLLLNVPFKFCEQHKENPISSPCSGGQYNDV